MSGDRLTIAIPRGALMVEALDCLERAGIDTAEVRSNDRKLHFPDVGIVTVRPSDVPTYVESGAADLGITGKDVLVEQSYREFVELADLDFGGCTMVVASIAGDPDPMDVAAARLGVIRVATKYPKQAGAWFAAHGKQVEIVEVKGSVELAPLTGMADGIVDLVASGATLRENGLVARDEISTTTARLIANPVSHRLKATEMDRVAALMTRA
ncbi:MAG: ATP phosphoribosyltransferase [Actinobacteria bacterium]|uniref:ATP phosphoribosyltransferase n=1 Tax=freshwater metagenome TaxID=449393 RepID=A0A6J7DZ01_9ZZZZ|nr:ATP phosphoribosyltransferase [Actinomycetota bacterium]